LGDGSWGDEQKRKDERKQDALHGGALPAMERSLPTVCDHETHINALTKSKIYF
jgi:hypothetical protein